MRIFQLARHPTRAIRAALVALIVTLGLNAFAHAGHAHEGSAANNATATMHSGCGYCAAFSVLSDGPRAIALVTTTPSFELVDRAPTATPTRRFRSSASSRGPPHL